MLDFINNLNTLTLILMAIGAVAVIGIAGYAIGFAVCKRSYSKVISSLQQEVNENSENTLKS